MRFAIMVAPKQPQQPQQPPLQQPQQPQQPPLQQPQQPQQPSPQPQQPEQPHQPQPALNWSHFNPEMAGRPAEDVEAHLLCTNDWMNIHNIPEGLKVGRFCLTLVGEARLWYESP